MKKMIALLCVAVLAVGSASAVSAAPSKTVSGVLGENGLATDANENEVTVSVTDVPEKDKAVVEEIKTNDKLKESLGDAYNDNISILDVKNVTDSEDDMTFPADITFDVTGVTADSKVNVLQYNTDTQKWENLGGKSGDGTVTANMKSLGTVAFAVDKTTVSADLPKTGEANTMLWAGIIAVAALAGMAVSFKKKKEA